MLISGFYKQDLSQGLGVSITSYGYSFELVQENSYNLSGRTYTL